jgi:hypothetical protein
MHPDAQRTQDPAKRERTSAAARTSDRRPAQAGWNIVRSDGEGRIEISHRDKIAPRERSSYLLIEVESFEKLAGRRATDVDESTFETLPSKLGKAARALFEMVRLAPVVDAPHPLAELVGPVWSTRQAVVALDTTRQNLADLARRHRTIRLRTSSGTYWWPTFQFRRVGGRVQRDPGIQRLWERLPHETFDDWELAAWMLTSRHDLGGRRPIDLAATERAVDQGELGTVVDNYRSRALR